MRVLIIVTDPQYTLLKNKEGWCQERDSEAWSMKVQEDLLIVAFQSLSDSENEEERLRQVRERTTQRVIDISRALGPNQYAGFLAYHSRYVITKQLRSQSDGVQFRAIAPFSHEINDSGEYVYPALCDLVANATAVTLDRAIDAIVARQGKSRTDRAATIRHKVIRLFLPAVLDLQTCHETGQTEVDLAEIARSYHRFFRQIEEARMLVYDCRSNTDSLEKIVRECGRAEDETWRQTKRLLPRAYPSDTERNEAQLFCEVFLERESSASDIFADRARIESFRLWCARLHETLLKLSKEIR